MQIRILVIDDEEPMCEILSYNLEKEGYEVDYALSAEEALEMDLTPYNLIITDIMMDKMSGFDFAKRIKNNPALEHKPIIFCSALNGEDDTVKGLNIGADDYITKPFAIGAVIARVRAVLRRAGVNNQNILTTIQGAPAVQQVEPQKQVQTANTGKELSFRSLVMNMDEKNAYVNGKPLKLTRKEFDLLKFFLENRGKIFSREEIRENVWGEDVVVSQRAIDTNVTRLRTKIEDYSSHIVTRNGFGYGFQEEI
ncbi:MAG: response regulator transcription factor [Muribaculaceae bacterium]|nr:response regulator transcription factor [Muribaculaceae bacterium]